MQLDPSRGYDLIGDVHGCANTLKCLLERLGYRSQAGVWRHPRRLAIFLGDIIDRGPRILEAVELVRDMVRGGAALCIMGNHEYYALGWSTPAPPGSGRQYVREHVPRHARLISETLAQYEASPQAWRDTLAWFYELPLFLDAGHFRVVHACWDERLIEPLRAQFADGCIDERFLQQTVLPGSFACAVFDRLLRGIDMRLPHGLSMTSGDGFTRSYFRTKFWEENPQTYGDLQFQPDALPQLAAQTPLSELQKAELLKYGPEQPLLFVGHYWRRGLPEAIRPNLVCLDYSAVKYGKLVAYRLDQERSVDPSKFLWVEVTRSETAQ
jgi:hypothetical protein